MTSPIEKSLIPDGLEEDLRRVVVEDVDVLARVVAGVLALRRRAKVFREWYEAERKKRAAKIEFLEELAASYAVAWRQRTGSAKLPVGPGKISIERARIVDLSDSQPVEEWVFKQLPSELQIHAALCELRKDDCEDRDIHVATICRRFGIRFGDTPLPIKVTTAVDWSALKDWAKFDKSGIGPGHDPRTGEEIPGLKRGRANEWTVSIGGDEEQATSDATDEELLPTPPEPA